MKYTPDLLPLILCKPLSILLPIFKSDPSHWLFTLVPTTHPHRNSHAHTWQRAQAPTCGPHHSNPACTFQFVNNMSTMRSALSSLPATLCHVTFPLSFRTRTIIDPTVNSEKEKGAQGHNPYLSECPLQIQVSLADLSRRRSM